ncbi:MAG: hypothetical protein ACI9EX_001854, partial [Oleispira sp.]
VGNIRGNPVADLPAAQLIVNCATVGCGNGDPLQVTLSWRARTGVADIEGRIRQANDNSVIETRTVNP